MELTQHIKERYAERMAGRDSKIDVNTYVAQNSDKIERDIDKLLEHSEVIFRGVTSSGKAPVTVRLSGTWVIITDQNDRVVITLYKVDLGLTEEFNKDYIKAWLDKLNQDMKDLSDRKAKNKDEVEAYKKAIKDNEELMAECEATIKRLKKDNMHYDEIIKGKTAEYFDAELRVRNDIEALTTKRREF